MRVNSNYAHFRRRITQLRRELKHLVRNLNDDFYETLMQVYIPQMMADIQEEVPEETGALAESINVQGRNLKKGFSVTVSARVYNPKTGYNYAYIQHENEEYSHEKVGAKAHYIEDPFIRMIEDIAALELDIKNYDGIPERDS